MKEQIIKWGLQKDLKGLSDIDIYNMICDNFYITDYEEARKCSFELFYQFNK